MNDHRYIPLKSHMHARVGAPGLTFIKQSDLRVELPRAIDSYMKERGILFLDSVAIATESLSPLAVDTALQLVHALGYRAICENTSLTGKYLGSDGGGHYSSDYYEIMQYALVTITP